MNSIKKIFLIGTLLGGAAYVYGEDAPLTAQRWSESWQQQYDTLGSSTGFVRRLVFVNNFATGDIPQFVDIPKGNFTSLGYFGTVDSQDLIWTYKLNRNSLESLGTKTKFATQLTDLFRVSNADTVVIAANDRPNWDFIRLNNGAPVRVLSAPPPADRKSQDELFTWVNELLGYDGVVLAKNGRFVLAVAPKKLLQTKIQALAIADSENMISVSGADKSGKALLELVDSYNEFAVFRVVTYGRSRTPIEYATKLILQKK